MVFNYFQLHVHVPIRSIMHFVLITLANFGIYFDSSAVVLQGKGNKNYMYMYNVYAIQKVQLC